MRNGHEKDHIGSGSVTQQTGVSGNYASSSSQLKPTLLTGTVAGCV